MNEFYDEDELKRAMKDADELASALEIWIWSSALEPIRRLVAQSCKAIIRIHELEENLEEEA